MVHPKSPTATSDIRDVRAAATDLGPQVQVFPAASEAEIDSAFDEMTRKQIGGALIGTDTLFVTGQARFR